MPFNEAVKVGTESIRKPRAGGTQNARPKMQPIKYHQRFAFKSPQWRSWFGMRSLVESSNALLKTKDHGDIETPTKRSGRGYAATYLALTYAVVASNLKRIATFFVAEAQHIESSQVTHRSRRRKDDLGHALETVADPGPPELLA